MKNIAVLGATGLVGLEVVKILEQRNFPVDKLFLYASEQSEGRTVRFRDRDYEVLADCQKFLSEADLVFGCLDEELAATIIPEFQKKAVVIDNSSAYRLVPDVPLIIPEVNPGKIKEHKGLIANPNCSTIQMLVALFPLHKEFKIRQIMVATYQSVSGYGRDAVDELKLEYEYLALDEPYEKPGDAVFPVPIGNNVIPQIGGFDENGYSREEMKMVDETRKILDDQSIPVSATCVRVPVLFGHSEAVHVDFQNPVSAEQAKEILKQASGVKLLEDDREYPMPWSCVGKDEVFVGRVRKDLAFENGLALWVVADNVRKGAALNAVQIAELLG